MQISLQSIITHPIVNSNNNLQQVLINVSIAELLFEVTNYHSTNLITFTDKNIQNEY